MDYYVDCVPHRFRPCRKKYDCHVLLSSLSVVAALNQLLYLPIVLWAMYEAPEKMIMTYAIVVGAHFLTYYWIYFSPTYFYAAIIIPIASLLLGMYFSQVVVCLAFK